MIQPIEGLSRREQIKLERLIRNEQAQKALTHKKSYRKRPKNTQNQHQPPQRKLIKNEANSAEEPAEEISSSIQENTKRQESQPESQPLHQVEKEKIPKKPQLSRRLRYEGGEVDFFNYIMAYSYEEKQKFIEEREQDLEFLNGLKGSSVEKMDLTVSKPTYTLIRNQYESLKKRIQHIYDGSYQSFIDEWFPKDAFI